jgi:pimeloyl-ACP methyl ester carboxylesterase
MHSLGVTRAHVVGHSLGANIVLQLALDAPDMVHSLALLEPARPLVPGASASEYVRAIYEPAFAHYRSGDKAGAVETFMRGVCGPAYRSALERAVADAETFFGQDQPAVQQWSFTRQDASRIPQPVLAVIGAKSREVAPFFEERQALLLAWFPQVEPFVLPEATHLLQVQNPGGLAQGPFRGRFLESRQTSKEKRGTEREKTSHSDKIQENHHCIGGMRCLIANKYPNGNRRCQALCRI